MTRPRNRWRVSEEREKEFNKLNAEILAIEAGQFDDVFGDAETKAALLADLKAQASDLIKAELNASELFVQGIDRKWRLTPEGSAGE